MAHAAPTEQARTGEAPRAGWQDSGGAAPGGDAKRPCRKRARLRNGRAHAPDCLPRRVKLIIAAANRIAKKPYIYGGGHNARFAGAGYDCSGSVSYALRGAKLLRAPLASGGLMSWGRPGKGRWVTVYAHGGHAYMHIAGLRFDTSARKSGGTRWARSLRSPAGGSYTARHPRGL